MHPSTKTPFKGKSLLLVEDEIIIGLDMEEMLMDAGAAQVDLCGSLADAFETVAREPPSAAVLDFRLAGENTLSLALHLMSQGIPFIFCIGQHLPAEVQRQLPDIPVLYKPILPADLVATLARMIDGQAQKI